MPLSQPLVDRGDFPSALAPLQEALVALVPTPPPGMTPAHVASVHAHMAAALAGLGDYESASSHLALAAKLSPQDASLHYERGVLLQQLGRDNEALIAYATALKLDPALAAAYVNLGNLHESAGRHLEAQQAYEAATELPNPRGDLDCTRCHCGTAFLSAIAHLSQCSGTT